MAIHVYSSVTADPSGNGEGEFYRGTVSLTTDGAGAGSFTFNGPAIPLTHQVTATATAPDGTSEFSAARAIAAAPTIQFSSITYAVGEAAGPATITLIRTGDLSVISTVQFATSNDTAIAGLDYTAASGTVTFNSGDGSATFNVAITNDGVDELDETLNLTLSNATAASLGVPSAAQLAIVDNDLQPSVSIGDVTLAEGNAGTTNFTFTLTLSAPSGLPVTVNYQTADGSATAGSDYTAATAVATIGVGFTTTTIVVAVTGDPTFEGDETFFVDLTGATGATISDNQGLGTITNDDLATADLNVAKTASSATFTPNQQITFTISVTNGGPVAATGVVVTDTLPAGLTFVSVTSATASCGGTTTVTCTIPALAVSASATISLVASASGTTPITNVASVAANESDPVPANNSSSVAIAPAPPAPVPTLSAWMLMALALMLGVLAVRVL